MSDDELAQFAGRYVDHRAGGRQVLLFTDTAIGRRVGARLAESSAGLAQVEVQRVDHSLTDLMAALDETTESFNGAGIAARPAIDLARNGIVVEIPDTAGFVRSSPRMPRTAAANRTAALSIARDGLTSRVPILEVIESEFSDKNAQAPPSRCLSGTREVGSSIQIQAYSANRRSEEASHSGSIGPALATAPPDSTS